MAIGTRTAQTQDQASGTGITLTKPTGTADGDWIVAVMTCDDANSGVGTQVMSEPSGWTVLGFVDQPKLWVWVKEAGASEPADYTWSIDNSTTWCGWIQAFSGALGVFECRPASDNEATSDYTAPAFETYADGCFCFDVGAVFGSTTGRTPTSGWTEEADLGTGLFDVINMHVQSKTVDTASETARSVSGNTNLWSAATVVVVPDTESDYRPTAGEFIVRGFWIGSYDTGDNELMVPGSGLSDLDGDMGVVISCVGDSSKSFETVTGWTQQGYQQDTGQPDIACQVYTRLMDGTETAGSSTLFDITSAGADTSGATAVTVRGAAAWTSDAWVSDDMGASDGGNVTVPDVTVADDDSLLVEMMFGDQADGDQVTAASGAFKAAAAQNTDSWTGLNLRFVDSGASGTNTWTITNVGGSNDASVTVIELGPTPVAAAGRRRDRTLVGAGARIDAHWY